MIYSLLIGLAIFTFVSCNKSETLTATQQETAQLIIDEQDADVTGTDIDALTDEALQLKVTSFKYTNAEGQNYIGSCPILTIDSAATPKKLTIDFGTTCVGKDGKTRSGKIIVTSTNFTKLGVDRSLSFENYMVNGKMIAGSIIKTITFASLTTKKAHVIDNITITLPENKGVVTRTSDVTREFKLVGSTLTTWGAAQFTNTKGVKITKSIAELTPLIFKFTCKQIVSGKQVVTRGDKTFTTDFGDGSCDDMAIVNDGTKSWPIKLK